MRSLVILAAFAALSGLSLAFPHVGVLTWAWIAFMSPHRLTWDFTHTFQFNLIIALLTAVAWALSREPKRIPLNPATVLIGLFMAWMTVSTLASLTPEVSWPLWQRHIKVMIFALVVAGLMRSAPRLHALVWVTVLAIGFYGVKGGGFTIAHGGRSSVVGPDDSMIEDQNHLALALCMVLPLMNYLRLQSAVAWVRWGLVAAMALTIVGTVGTYSRGGFLALAVTAFMFWLRSQAKLAALAGLLLALVPAVTLMPESWRERIATIEGYAQDPSVQGRFDAWTYAVTVALDRPLVGGGISSTEDPRVFERYNPGREARAAHSLYFQVLGDQGFVGLGLFLGIAWVGWRNTAAIIRVARGRPELGWACDLARMFQIGFVSYFVAGMALSMAYYGVFFVMTVMAATVNGMVRQAPAAGDAAVTPGVDRPTTGRRRRRRAASAA